ADAKDLAADLRVRLWSQAGDWERAARLARRFDIFSEAVSALKKNHPDAATKLTALWAAHRAEVGDFVGAIEIIWPHKRPVESWIDAAIQLGGTAAARILPKRLALHPEAFDEVKAQIQILLDDPSEEGRQARRALTSGLIDERSVPGVSTLARGVARQRIADAPRSSAERHQIDELIRISQDGALKTHRPPWPKFTAPETISLESSTNDRGQAAVHDAVRLATGRILVALGEAGVMLLTGDGRCLTHFRVSATSLVPSDTGHRALALIRRGQLTQIHRIDLVHWRATTWCEQHISVFAPTFNGWTWFAAVSEQPQVLMLDVTGDRPKTEWTIGQGAPLLLDRHAQKVALLAQQDELRIERYNVAQLRLEHRQTPDALRDAPDGSGRPGETASRDAESTPERKELVLADLDGMGNLLIVHRHTEISEDQDEAPNATWSATRHPNAIKRTLDFPPNARPIAVSSWGNRFAVAMAHDDGVTVRGFEWHRSDALLYLRLNGAARAGVRRLDERVIVWDDTGRVFVVHLVDGAIEHSLRIRI
ncbi:MAG: hypothetical protein AAFV29_05340, partial [Myxococcota bacterium]